MKKQIASVFALSLFSLTFPFVLVCAFFYGAVWGNFTFGYDVERGEEVIQKLWLEPCSKIITWGWRDYRSYSTHDRDEKELQEWLIKKL